MSFQLTDPFHFLATVYIVLVVAHFGVQFILAHLNHLKQKREAPALEGAIQRALAEERFPAVSVIYPIYNEDPAILRRVFDHATDCLQIPNLELIFVDDGSPNVEQLRPVYESYRRPGITIIYSDNNGKRAAQYRGMQAATGDYVVTVDSDTLINVDCIYKVVAPMLVDPKLGAVTGDVRVENKGVNWLTRLISQRYWLAFNLERAAQSITGAMLCCSGPLAIYRNDVLQRVKERYINQRFLSELCTYGDDRHLTNLVLAEGYRTRFQQGAIAHTYVPTTMREYIVQQTRWNKSFYRELFWTLKAARHISAYALWDVVVQTLLFFLFVVAMAYHLFIFLNTMALQIAVGYVVLVILMASLRAFYGFARTRQLHYLMFVIYGFIHVAILMPVRFKALLTLKNNRWGTRAGKNAPGYGSFGTWIGTYLATIGGLTALMTASVPNTVVENLRHLSFNTSISFSQLGSGILASWTMGAPVLSLTIVLFVGRVVWLEYTRWRSRMAFTTVAGILLLLTASLAGTPQHTEPQLGASEHAVVSAVPDESVAIAMDTAH